MSIHSDLMRSATDVLVMVQGDAGAAAPVQYKSPGEGKQAFTWDGSCLGVQKGRWMPLDNDDLLKVTSMLVQGPTDVLVANGVTQIENEAVVTVGGVDWSIDPAESTFGPSLVRLGLFRRPIVAHYQAQDNAQR